MLDFIPTPSAAWCYTVPPDGVTQDQLHYVVVQISERRHVVAEYDSKGQGVLQFRTVSKPLPYDMAVRKAQELRDARVSKAPSNPSAPDSV